MKTIKTVKPIEQLPFGREYRLAKFKGITKSALGESNVEQGLSLADFKCQEYLLRLLRQNPLKTSDMIGSIHLRRQDLVSLMKKVVQWRKSKAKDPFSKSKWTIPELESRIRRDALLVIAWMDHLNNGNLMEDLWPDILVYAEKGFKETVAKSASAEDPLGIRLRQIRDALRLTELEEEILLCVYLLNWDPGVHFLHAVVKKARGELNDRR